tara:strand:+ start:3361 stop:3615 length:255 start_codon:yes stop_codon:yes gene_type:complete
MTNIRYIIIGRSTCRFCIHAVDFCQASKIEYIFLDYSENLEILEEKKLFYNQKTVPIILSNSLDTGLTKRVGGYTDLLERYRDE